MSQAAYQAATKALYLGTPAFLDPGLVHRIVDAALAAHDTVIHHTEPNLHRQMWEDAPFRQMVERRMREQLLGKAVEEGCVPVALPTAAYRYFTEPEFYLTSRGPWRRPVPPELVELGAAWEWIEVELSVPVRCITPKRHTLAGARTQAPADPRQTGPL